MYLSCFMLILLLAASTSSPFANFADEENYDGELNTQYNAWKNKRGLCNFVGKPCNSFFYHIPINGCCPGATCSWGTCIEAGKK